MYYIICTNSSGHILHGENIIILIQEADAL